LGCKPSTLPGGAGIASAGTELAIDSFGDMVIAGLTHSGDSQLPRPRSNPSTKATGKDATNAFLTVLDPADTSPR
jgi:hypothetical protein